MTNGPIAQLVRVNMLENLLNLYPEYTKWYGPHFHENEGRFYIFLYNPVTEKRTTISYAKAIIQCNFNRLLNDDEEVDHIDNNKVNDELDNLQILTTEQNRRKQSELQYALVTCTQCKIQFKKKLSRIRQRNSFITKNRHFCSKQCVYASRRK